jgi:rare lipoprotein A
MSLRLLIASTAALIWALTGLAHAQPAPVVPVTPVTQVTPAPADIQPAPVLAPAPVAETPVLAPAPSKRGKKLHSATSISGNQGKIAYYGGKFAGRKTASGERFNPSALTMAHRTLPFGTMVRVTNLNNNKRVTVRVNDRGPSTPDRMGDVSKAAAIKLGMIKSGTAQVRFEVMGKSRAKGAMRHKMHKHRK